MHLQPMQHPMKRAMVIGAVASFMAETGSKKLARWGIAVDPKLHVDIDKSARRPALVPAGSADIVVIFCDMVGDRGVVAKWKEAARQAAKPCIILTRHEASWGEEMKRQGLEPINPVTAAAVAITKDEDKMEPKKPAQVVPIPAKPAAPAAGFLERKEKLKALLKEMSEKDGLREVMFSPETGFSLRRMAVESYDEDV